MPLPPNTGSDTRANDYLSITDFSAGIVTNPNFQQSNVGNLITANNFGNLVMTLAQKPSAALVDNNGGYTTFGCQGAHDGSLVPLPYPTPVGFDLSTTKNGLNAGTTVIPILGAVSASDSVFYATTYVGAGGASINVELRNTANINAVDNHTVVSAPTFPITLGSQVCLGYLNVAGTIYPTILYGYYNNNAAASYYFYYASQGAAGTQIGTGRSGWFFSHQGRFIFLENLGLQSNFSNADTNFTTLLGVNLISFTDPPQTNSLGTQRQIFGNTFCDSFTTVGVMSSGELLMVTENNGGVVVSGDVFSPYITTVPGVTGTGRMFGNSAITPAGMAYLSNPSGLWAWNGGASSQFLSPQLMPNFWQSSGAYSGISIADVTRFNVTFFNNWIVCPDNWILDLTTNGWWILYPPTQNQTSAVNNSNFYYSIISSGVGNQALVGLPSWVATNHSRLPVSFQTTVLTRSYQWTSNNFQVSNGQLCDINEIILTATNLDNQIYNITVSLLDVNGNTQTVNPIPLSPNMRKPQQFRAQTPHIQTDIVSIKINVSGTNLATPSTNFPCIINGIALGFRRMTEIQTR